MIKIYDGRNEFFQWDLDRKLIVSDQTVTELHFCNKTSDCSLVVEVKDGIADVPNILLQTDWTINVYAYCGKCYTKEHVTFKVNKRSKPDDYVYTETEVKRWEDIEKRVNETLDNVANAENVREVAETIRANNETERIAAEEARESAETERETYFTQFMEKADSNLQAFNTTSATDLQAFNDAAATNLQAFNNNATAAIESANEQIAEIVEDGNTAVENVDSKLAELSAYEATLTSHGNSIVNHETRLNIQDKQLANLERHISNDYFVTDETIEYNKTIPANTCPYAQINKIGGMTRKCTNLIPFPYELSTVSNGTTFAVNQDLSIDVSGKPTVSIYNTAATLTLKAGTYSLHNYSSLNANVRLYITYGNITLFANDTFTLSEETSVRVRIAVYDTFDGNTVRIVPMLNEGSTALPYEPYFEGLRSAPVSELVSEGANNIPYPYVDTTKTVNGITFTDNGDGTVTANGTAMGNADFKLSNRLTVKKGMILSGAPVGGDWGTFEIQAYLNAGNSIHTNAGDEIATHDFVAPAIIRIRNGYTANNLLFKPMLNKGGIVLPYKPFKAPVTFPIPEAVRAEYGINENVYDYIEWCEDGTRKKHKCVEKIVFDGTEDWSPRATGYYIAFENLGIKQLSSAIGYSICTYDDFVNAYSVPNSQKHWYIGTTGFMFEDFIGDLASWIQRLADKPLIIVAALAEPEVTDISDILTDDNFIEVEGDGSITAVNEFGYDVPSSISYLLKEGSI